MGHGGREKGYVADGPFSAFRRDDLPHLQDLAGYTLLSSAPDRGKRYRRAPWGGRPASPSPPPGRRRGRGTESSVHRHAAARSLPTPPSRRWPAWGPAGKTRGPPRPRES